MRITMDELALTQQRISITRVRKYLHRMAMQGRLQDLELLTACSAPFWQKIGYARLYDYLTLELRLDDERAMKITALAVEKNYEKRELYGPEKSS